MITFHTFSHLALNLADLSRFCTSPGPLTKYIGRRGIRSSLRNSRCRGSLSKPSASASNNTLSPGEAAAANAARSEDLQHVGTAPSGWCTPSLAGIGAASDAVAGASFDQGSGHDYPSHPMLVYKACRAIGASALDGTLRARPLPPQTQAGLEQSLHTDHQSLALGSGDFCRKGRGFFRRGL